MKRMLSAIGLGAAVVVAALSAACGTQSLSSSTQPVAPPFVSAPTASEPAAVASPAPAVVALPSPTAPTSYASASPSVTLRSSSTPKVTVAPTSSSCGEDYYRNVDGVCVHRPTAAPAAPAGASAICGDGTYSFSQHRQGTCSHHGGVATWL